MAAVIKVPGCRSRQCSRSILLSSLMRLFTAGHDEAARCCLLARPRHSTAGHWWWRYPATGIERRCACTRERRCGGSGALPDLPGVCRVHLGAAVPCRQHAVSSSSSRWLCILCLSCCCWYVPLRAEVVGLEAADGLTPLAADRAPRPERHHTITVGNCHCSNKQGAPGGSKKGGAAGSTVAQERWCCCVWVQASSTH